MLITDAETTALFRDDHIVRMKFLLSSGYSSVRILRWVGDRYQGGPRLANLLRAHGVILHTHDLGCPLSDQTQRCTRELAEYASEILLACGYTQDLRGTVAFRRQLRRQAPQGRLDTAMTIRNPRFKWLLAMPRSLAWKVVKVIAKAMYLTGTTTIRSLRERLRISDNSRFGQLKISHHRPSPSATAAQQVVPAVSDPAPITVQATPGRTAAIEFPATEAYDWSDAQAFSLYDLMQLETVSIWVSARSGKSSQSIRRSAEVLAQQSGEIPLSEWLEKKRYMPNADIGAFRLEELVTLFQWRTALHRPKSAFEEKIIGLIDRRRQELCAFLQWVPDCPWAIANALLPLATHGVTVEMCRDFDLQDIRFGDNADVFMSLLEDMTKKDLPRWKPPWSSVIPPQLPQRPNGRRYRSWRNSFWLSLAAQSFGYETGYWATRKTWARLGIKVTSGERAFPICGWFRNQYTGERKRDIAPEEREHLGWAYRVYPVYNAAQVVGWTTPDSQNVGDQDFDDIAEVEDFIQRTEAKIRYQSAFAAYYPSLDEIRMPSKADFKPQTSASAEALFYSTLLHELIHWTGADKRTGRIKKDGLQHSHCIWHEKEELVAEFGATFLCAQLRITKTPLQNHVTYLDHWFEQLKKDPTVEPARELLSAAEQALDAIRYLNKLVAAPIDEVRHPPQNDQKDEG